MIFWHQNYPTAKPLFFQIENNETGEIVLAGSQHIKADNLYCIYGTLHAVEMAVVISRYLADYPDTR